LTLELCLLGEVLALPEKLFFYRLFAKKTIDEMAAGLSPAENSSLVSASYSQFGLAMARTIQRAALPRREAATLLLQFWWGFLVRNVPARNYIYEDVGRQVRVSWRARRYRDVLAFLTLAGAVLPGRLIGLLKRAVRGREALTKPKAAPS
jgi:hypothetical protein